jgi:hypothetical protein
MSHNDNTYFYLTTTPTHIWGYSLGVCAVGVVGLRGCARAHGWGVGISAGLRTSASVCVVVVVCVGAHERMVGGVGVGIRKIMTMLSSQTLLH